MTLRVACDTNVLVSAAVFGGPPGRILEHAVGGRFELVLLEPVLVELDRVLRLKFTFDDERLAELSSALREIGTVAPAVDGPVATVTGDRDDDRVLAAAVSARVDVLVSGDRRHLLPLGRHGGVRIVLAQSLLAEIAV